MPGSIQQREGNLWLRLLCDLLGHLRLLTQLSILSPGLGQKQLGADGEVKRCGAGRIVGEEFGTHHHLRVANFAQRPGVLRGHADRGVPLLRQAGIVKDQHAIAHRMQCEQALDARFVQCEWVPGRIGQQVLQALNRGSGDHVGDRVARLVGQVRQQPREVALHAVPAGVPPKQRSKRF